MPNVQTQRHAQTPPRADRPTSVVYFVVDASQRVKIGTTHADGVDLRLTELQTGNADTLSLLAVIPGGVTVERRIHRQFVADHVRGEWFALSDELVGFLTSCLSESNDSETSTLST